MFKLPVREQILVGEMKGKFWVLAVIISAVVAGSAGYFPAVPPDPANFPFQPIDPHPLEEGKGKSVPSRV